jgi:hypothetical protein
MMRRIDYKTACLWDTRSEGNCDEDYLNSITVNSIRN